MEWLKELPILKKKDIERFLENERVGIYIKTEEDLKELIKFMGRFGDTVNENYMSRFMDEGYFVFSDGKVSSLYWGKDNATLLFRFEIKDNKNTIERLDILNKKLCYKTGVFYRN